jgi:hypothetical protein
MRELLGQYSVVWDGEITWSLENNQISFPDTTSDVNNHYNAIKNMLYEIYGDTVSETSGDDYEEVVFRYSDEGSTYRFRKDGKGLTFIIEQPFYHPQVQKFSKREYLLVPLFRGETLSLSSLVIPAEFSVQGSSDIVCYRYKESEYYYYISGWPSTAHIEPDVLSSNWYALPGLRGEIRCSHGMTHVEDISFWIRFSPSLLLWKILLRVSSAFSFFDELLIMSYSRSGTNRIESRTTLTFIETYASRFEEIDRYNSCYFTKEDVSCVSVASANLDILELDGNLDLLKPYARARIVQLASSILPKYLVETEHDLAEFVGQIGFVLDKKTSRYNVISLVNVEQEDDQIFIQLDNFLDFPITDETYLVMGVMPDFTARVSQKNFYQESPNWFYFGQEGEDLCFWRNYISHITFGFTFIAKPSVMFEQTITQDGDSIDTLFPALKMFFVGADSYPNKVILPLPLVPVSQRDFASQPPGTSFLSYDAIDDLGKVGMLKPTLLAYPHPSGNGNIIPAQLPNYYALKIRDKIGYAPSKIFIMDKPAMATSKGAYIASWTDRQGPYDVYIVLGKVKKSPKPFKLVSF